MKRSDPWGLGDQVYSGATWSQGDDVTTLERQWVEGTPIDNSLNQIGPGLDSLGGGGGGGEPGGSERSGGGGGGRRSRSGLPPGVPSGGQFYSSGSGQIDTYGWGGDQYTSISQDQAELSRQFVMPVEPEDIAGVYFNGGGSGSGGEITRLGDIIDYANLRKRLAKAGPRPADAAAVLLRFSHFYSDSILAAIILRSEQAHAR